MDHRVGWVERSETQHFVFVGFCSSTQPTFHALDETMIKAVKIYIFVLIFIGFFEQQLTWVSFFRIKVVWPKFREVVVWFVCHSHFYVYSSHAWNFLMDGKKEVFKRFEFPKSG